MKALRTVVAAATLLASAQAIAHGRLADISVYDRNEGRWLQVYRLGEELLARRVSFERASSARAEIIALHYDSHE